MMDIVEELNRIASGWPHPETDVTARAADLIVSLREQLAFAMAHPTEVERTLREQVAALTKERDELINESGAAKEKAYNKLMDSLAASQAREAKLREAIGTVCEGWTLPEGVRKTLEKALALPADDTALKERLKDAYWDGYKAGHDGDK